MSIDTPQYLLIVANSARMLVQAAKAAGFKPLAIDLWADKDTLYFAEAYQHLPDLSLPNVAAAVDYFLARFPISHVVYGAGLEAHPDSLNYLGDRLSVMGNPPDLFARLHDKQSFFRMLKQLAISFPEVRFNPPASDYWLEKPIRGQGGRDIRPYRKDNPTKTNVYWQKYQQGQPHSALFLADGNTCQIIGFNKQWTVSLGENDRFVFSGVINHTDLEAEQKHKISSWLDKLMQAFSFKGLNSLDFIQNGQDSYVLEINPRPSASMQLYGADMFAWHIKACQGELLADIPKPSGCAAYQIVYTQQPLQIPDRFEWPEHAVDIPVTGSIIGKGQPICSIIMEGKEPDKVLQQLQISQGLIINQLIKVTNSWNTHRV